MAHLGIESIYKVNRFLVNFVINNGHWDDFRAEIPVRHSVPHAVVHRNRSCAARARSVQPAHANYYEIGISEALFGKLRLDANVFRRNFRNYSDDDVLLDTGVSFPIAFARARIFGEELRMQVPHW